MKSITGKFWKKNAIRLWKRNETLRTRIKNLRVEFKELFVELNSIKADLEKLGKEYNSLSVVEMVSHKCPSCLKREVDEADFPLKVKQ